RFPAMSGWRWGFHEVARRQGDFAMAGALVGLSVDANSIVQAARLVVFAVEDRARRMDAVLAGLLGRPADGIDFGSVALSAAAEVDPRSDLHADADLRLHLVYTCVTRALTDAATALPGA